jgi:hypothetical protein
MEHPVTDAKRQKQRRPWLMRFYYGPDYSMDMPHNLMIGIGGRPDLLKEPEDLGRMVPVVFGMDATWGCYPESVERGHPKWYFSFRARSEISEIATRLAGGPE